MTLCINYDPNADYNTGCEPWVTEKLVPFLVARQQDCPSPEDRSSRGREGTCAVELRDLCGARSTMENRGSRELRRNGQDMESQLEEPEAERQDIAGHGTY